TALEPEEPGAAKRERIVALESHRARAGGFFADEIEAMQLEHCAPRRGPECAGSVGEQQVAQSARGKELGRAQQRRRQWAVPPIQQLRAEKSQVREPTRDAIHLRGVAQCAHDAAGRLAMDGEAQERSGPAATRERRASEVRVGYRTLHAEALDD